jgi:hypothetical protein
MRTEADKDRELAGMLGLDVSRRFSETIVLFMDWCDEDGRPINQRQKVVLVESMLRAYDGLERDFEEQIRRDREGRKVAVDA